ncbi:hypothetical protein P5V15_011063 [Pogonomyrmex californicus]
MSDNLCQEGLFFFTRVYFYWPEIYFLIPQREEKRYDSHKQSRLRLYGDDLSSRLDRDNSLPRNRTNLDESAAVSSEINYGWSILQLRPLLAHSFSHNTVTALIVSATCIIGTE